MQIRTVKKEDNKPLAEIIRAVFEEFDAPRTGTVFSDPTTDALYELFQKENAVLWVIESENKVSGCCGIFPTPGLPENYAELVKFYISPDMRGKGAGKNLMEACFASAKKLGYTHLYIESLPVFTKAISIYEHAGFKLLNHALGNSGHNSCNVWMLKTL